MHNQTEAERKHRSNPYLSGTPKRLWELDDEPRTDGGEAEGVENINGHAVKESASSGLDEWCCVGCWETRPSREAFETFPCAGGGA